MPQGRPTVTWWQRSLFYFWLFLLVYPTRYKNQLSWPGQLLWLVRLFSDRWQQKHLPGTLKYVVRSRLPVTYGSWSDILWRNEIDEIGVRWLRKGDTNSADGPKLVLVQYTNESVRSTRRIQKEKKKKKLGLNVTRVQTFLMPGHCCPCRRHVIPIREYLLQHCSSRACRSCFGDSRPTSQGRLVFFTVYINMFYCHVLVAYTRSCRYWYPRTWLYSSVSHKSARQECRYQRVWAIIFFFAWQYSALWYATRSCEFSSLSLAFRLKDFF